MKKRIAPMGYIIRLIAGLAATLASGETVQGQTQPAATNPPAQIAGAQDDQTTDKFEAKMLGDWILENASGLEMSPMQIKKTALGTYELIRIGGGPDAMCGEYTQGKMGRLVKVKKPGDAYWNLTWKYINGKLILKGEQYTGWTLRREKKWAK